MPATVSRILAELADREAIRALLARYCRAADRADEQALRAVYWPEAHDDHLAFSGTAAEFVAWALPNLRAMRFNHHLLGQVLIAIDGHRAEAESYFLGYHSVLGEDGVRRDSFSGGRYLDKLEKRGDEWRILRRLVVVDWFRELSDTQFRDLGPFGMAVPRGDLAPDDPSFRFFEFLR